MRNFSLTFCLVISALLASFGGGFASDLPDCPGSPTNKFILIHNASWTACMGIFENIYGRYSGTWKDGKRYGQGTYTYSNGDKYVGEFKDDKKHGQGTFTWAPNSEGTGDKYVGEWRDDKKNGQGTYSYASGGKYVGEWRDDTTHGQGTFTWTNGDKYVGEWKDDKRNGQGTHTRPNGDKHVGEYKDGKKNGQGTDTFASGNKYVGEFKDDKKHGQGTFTWAPNSEWAGDKYVGEYKDGKKHGQGTYYHANGGKYVGEYRDGKKHGQGTFIWAPNSEGTGDKYVGEWRDDTTHGQGTYTYADGNKYVGEYKDGKKSGFGIAIFLNGDKYVGDWRDDLRHGQGTNTWGPNSEWAGNKYVGEYKDDKKSGLGTYTYSNGDKYVGEFRYDAANGQGTIHYSNGTLMEGIWSNWRFQYEKKLSPPVPVAKTPTQDDEIISASSGSGFAVSSDGYVITNHHVIDGCQKVVVHTKEKDLTVRVITYDPQNDLALLKGDFRPKTVFPLSNNRPELLQDIYVAGYPFGNKVSTSVKVTKGIISSLTGIGNNFSNIQIDAALQSGNSGGPILDDMGNVVGVAVSKLDAKYMFDNFGSIPENTNFGIKSNVVRSILDSNQVDGPSANQTEISKSKLGKMITDGTYYISCWMTMAQIKKMKTKKVFFSNLD
jgi:hypothetical protein